MTTLRGWFLPALTPLLLSAVGCAGDSISNADLPRPVLLSTTLEPLVVPKGWNALVPVFVDNTNAKAGPLTLSVHGLPNGVTGAFSKPTLTAAIDTSVLALEVADQTVPGNYSFTVVAASPGGVSASVSRPLTVPAPSVDVRLEPSELTQVLGAFSIVRQTSFEVVLTRRNGFRGRVNITVDRPSGIGVNYLPNGAFMGPGIDRLRIDLYGGGTTLIGTHEIIVNVVDEVIGTRSAKLRLTLTP